MKKQLRNRKLTVRFTDQEMTIINAKFEKTICRQLSDYVRLVLLEKPVTTKYRNVSLDAFMEEVILLKQEMNAIGHNFNQAVKKLHSLSQIAEFRQWLTANELTRQQVATHTKLIENRINVMAEKWLQG